jgi:hypothetical protein
MKITNESGLGPKMTGPGPPKAGKFEAYLTDIKFEGSNGVLAHLRLNHYGLRTIREAQNKGTLYTGLELTRENSVWKEHCTGCAVGKITRRHQVTQRKAKAVKNHISKGIDLNTAPGKEPKRPMRESKQWLTAKEIIETTKPFGYELRIDTVTPFPPAWDGSRHGFVCIETSTNTQVWLYGRDKSDTQGTKYGKKLRRRLLRSMDPTKVQSFYRLGSDRAGELLSDQFHRNAARELGIVDRRTNVPGVSHHNGRAERAIRTVTESAAAMMASQEVPQYLWTEAYDFAEAIYDKLPCRSNPNNYSPHQMRQILATGLEPEPDNVSWFRIPFTRVAYVEQRPRTDRAKGRGKLGVLVGLEPGTKGYTVMPINPRTKRLQPAHKRAVAPKDIYFDERNKMPTQTDIGNLLQDTEEYVDIVDLTAGLTDKTVSVRKRRKQESTRDPISAPEFEQAESLRDEQEDAPLDVELPEPPVKPKMKPAEIVLQRLRNALSKSTLNQRPEKGVSHREPRHVSDHDNWDNSVGEVIPTRENKDGLRRSERLAAQAKTAQMSAEDRALLDRTDAALHKIVGMSATLEEEVITREQVGKLPKSLAQAKKHKYAAQWAQAMEDHLEEKADSRFRLLRTGNKTRNTPPREANPVDEVGL